MEQPLVSVILPVYKESEKYIREAVDSILNQTYKNIELILMLDNPIDKWRVELLEQYRDNNSNVKLYINEKNMGLIATLNKAIDLCNGNYIARMDADDVSVLNRIEKQLEYLEKNKLDFISGNVQNFCDEKTLNKTFVPTKHSNIIKYIKYKNCFTHSLWFGKAIVFRKLKYRNVYSCEDYDFVIRAVQEGFKLGNVPEILINVRISTDSISRNNLGKQEKTKRFLAHNYKQNRTLSMTDFEEFSKKQLTDRRLKPFNKYCALRNKRAGENNRIKKLYYTILLVLKLKYSVYDIKCKKITDSILKKEKING